MGFRVFVLNLISQLKLENHFCVQIAYGHSQELHRACSQTRRRHFTYSLLIAVLIDLIASVGELPFSVEFFLLFFFTLDC